MPRIVSLIASATEMVAALGQLENLVGCSHECDYPESVKALPVCAVAPTHIVTQIQCEVFSVSLPDGEAAIARGMKSKP
jgi:iron complex transport system substrate-binding protein